MLSSAYWPAFDPNSQSDFPYPDLGSCSCVSGTAWARAQLLAASNRDPAKTVRDGLLREDLYFRLSVFPIALPPLRDRREDITVLAQLFLNELNEQNNTQKALAPKTLETLLCHTWPGNVRELKHTVHRAYIMAQSDVIDAPRSISMKIFPERWKSSFRSEPPATAGQRN